MDAYFKIKKILFAVQIDYFTKSLILLLFFYFNYFISLNPFKSFSYLVSLNKYHYHTGLYFPQNDWSPPNVLDMIMALFGINTKVSWK